MHLLFKRFNSLSALLRSSLLSANHNPSKRDYTHDDAYPAQPRFGNTWRDSIRQNLSQNLSGRNWEMEQLQEDITHEQRGRIALLSHNASLLQQLLEQLRQQPCPADSGWSNPRPEGLFTLTTLPLEARPSNHAEGEQVEKQQDGAEQNGPIPGWSSQPFSDDTRWQLNELLMDACEADCLIYVWRIEEGWQSVDAHCFARLRNMGVALLPIAIRQPTDSNDYAVQVQRLQQRIAVQPVLITLQPLPADALLQPTLPADVASLIERILALRPRLAIPLAADLPGYRPIILRRILRQGALLTALFGAEPVPLIDLPLQVAVSWKMALQIAAIYGRPGLDYRSREMMSTLATNLVTRALCQQALKLMPLVGWALSAAVSGGGAWMLGQTLIRYYERGALVDWPDPALQKAWHHAKATGSNLADAGSTIGKRSWHNTQSRLVPWLERVKRNTPDQVSEIPVVNEEQSNKQTAKSEPGSQRVEIGSNGDEQ